MKLTHEQVNSVETALRKAQSALEVAGQILCSADGEAVPALWGKITRYAEEVGGLVGECYKIRPW